MDVSGRFKDPTTNDQSQLSPIRGILITWENAAGSFWPFDACKALRPEPSWFTWCKSKSLVELRYLHVHWRSSDPPSADSCYRSQFWSRFLIALGGESKIAGRHQESLTLACYTLTVSRLCNSEHANWLLAKMLCSLGHVRTNTAWSRLLQHWRDRGKQSDTDYAAAWIGVILNLTVDGSLAVLRWFFHSFLEIAWLTCLVRHLALRWLNSKKAHDRFLNMQHDVSDLVSNINSPKAGLCAYELWKGVPGAQCAPAMSVKPVRAAHFDEASLMAGSQVWRVWTVIGSVWKCL